MKQKTDLKTYFKDLRNWYHVLIALSLGNDITLILFSNRENFPISWEYWNNALYPFIVGVPIWIGAFLWERRQDKIKEGSSDMRDVWLSAAAGVLGGYFSMFYPSWYVAIALTIISAIVFIQNYKK